MKILGIIYIILASCSFILLFYSIIRYIAVVIADRSDVKRRKRYSVLCAISIGILIALFMASTIYTLSRKL